MFAAKRHFTGIGAYHDARLDAREGGTNVEGAGVRVESGQGACARGRIHSQEFTVTRVSARDWQMAEEPTRGKKSAG